MNRFTTLSTRLALAAILTIPALAAPKGKMEMPDFTKGESVPTDARQIIITQLDKGSPADGILPLVKKEAQWAADFTYGTHGKAVIPELTKIGTCFEKDEKNFPKHLMIMKAECIRATIQAIEASTDTPELIGIQ